MTIIESKLIREGGTHENIGGTAYHFAPNHEGAHVCKVENEDHAERFLSIPEGYRLYRAPAKPVAASAGPSQEQQIENMTAHFAASAPIEPAAAAVLAPVDEREALADQYESLYGERPHARTGIKKLRELIAAKQ